MDNELIIRCVFGYRRLFVRRFSLPVLAICFQPAGTSRTLAKDQISIVFAALGAVLIGFFDSVLICLSALILRVFRVGGKPYPLLT